MGFESKLDRYVETTFRSNESERLKMQLIEEIRNATRNELRELRELIEIQKDIVESIDDKKQLADLENSLDGGNYSRGNNYQNYDNRDDRDNYYDNGSGHERQKNNINVNIMEVMNVNNESNKYFYTINRYSSNPNKYYINHNKKQNDYTIVTKDTIKLEIIDIFPNSINILYDNNRYITLPLTNNGPYKEVIIGDMAIKLDGYFPGNRGGNNRGRDRDNYYNGNDYRRNH